MGKVSFSSSIRFLGLTVQNSTKIHSNVQTDKQHEMSVSVCRLQNHLCKDKGLKRATQIIYIKFLFFCNFYKPGGGRRRREELGGYANYELATIGGRASRSTTPPKQFIMRCPAQCCRAGRSTSYFFYFFTLKKQDFLTIKTRLLSRANKASFKSKEALFSICIHWHTSAFILRCQRINEKYY